MLCYVYGLCQCHTVQPCAMRSASVRCACSAVAGAVRVRGVCMQCCCWCGAGVRCVRALYATTLRSHRALCGAKKTQSC